MNVHIGGGDWNVNSKHYWSSLYSLVSEGDAKGATIPIYIPLYTYISI